MPFPRKSYHIYGDFLKIYDSRISGKLSRIFSLQDPLRDFFNEALIIYGSYVLSKAGYDIEGLCSDDFYEEAKERIYSTTFDEDDWIQNAHFLYADPISGNQHINYVNKDKDYKPIYYMNNYYGNQFRNKVWSLFVGTDEIETTDPDQLAEELAEKYHQNGIVVVNPTLETDIFLKAKKRYEDYAGKDTFLMSYELPKLFFKTSTEIKRVEDGWTKLMKRLLNNFKKANPFIIIAENNQLYLEIEENIKNANAKMDLKQYDDAVRNAGMACEGLLQLANKIKGIESADKAEFSDLMGSLHSYIIEEYGQEVYNDLEYIRNWRNNVSHPGKVKPDEEVSIQVISRVELFYKLINKKLMLTSLND